MELLPSIYDEPPISNYSTPFGYSTALEDRVSDGKLFQGYPPALLTFASVACVTFIFLGVPGNLITIIALARCKKVRNATAVFIINLSLSDLLFCCFNLPLAASTFWHREWIHGEIMCRLFPLLRYGLLAVSLFTVLTITINRYIMIGHPRIYPRIYRHKFLILMVAGTWLAAFGTLIPTWRGKWGRFGLDASIGSCTIIPVNGSSPKEFLFLMAFVLPCFFIFICYARIFYIVRKTAMKSRDPHHLKTNGTERMTSNYNNNNNNNNIQTPQPAVTNKIPHNLWPVKALPENAIKNGNRLSFQEDDDSENRVNDSSSERSKNNSQNSSITNGQRMRRQLTKTKEEDLKFIDTSIESDLPPTLSQLQRKSVHISTEYQPLSSPSSTTATTATTILSLDSEQLNSISKDIDEPVNMTTNYLGVTVENKDLFIDSTVEDSTTISIDQIYNIEEQQNMLSNQLLAIQIEPSSSSGVELPYDQYSPQKNPRKTFAQILRQSAKIKKRKLKDSSNNGDNNMQRKKSAVNTSGASIMLAGRMTSKDRRLLKMILVIFISFLTCYLPITLTKIFRSLSNIHTLNIMGYLLVYLTTSINPIIYVVMSSEYRQAYWNLLMCRINNNARNGCTPAVNGKHHRNSKKT